MKKQTAAELAQIAQVAALVDAQRLAERNVERARQNGAPATALTRLQASAHTARAAVQSHPAWTGPTGAATAR